MTNVYICIKYNPIKIRKYHTRKHHPAFPVNSETITPQQAPSDFYHYRLVWTVFELLMMGLYSLCPCVIIFFGSAYLSTLLHYQFSSFIFAIKIIFIAKLRERNRDFSYNPCPHTCTTFSIINMSHQSDIFVTVNEPTLTHHY